jgi:uncharacterized protein (DUF488 family)
MEAAPFAGLEILSVGHSNVPYADLSALLKGAGATAVADVRSVPRSTRFPWFDGAALGPSLKADGIAYAFLGRELGGRPARADLLVAGRADYEAMAAEPAFAEGLGRVRTGALRHRVALLCSEGDPTECHRCLLVGRALREGGARVTHLRHRAGPVSQEAIEEDLLARAGRAGDDLFSGPDERLAEAYRLRAVRVAYAGPAP